ncbi:hypothetical protein [Glycomyces terrestris]|uniref:Uncharacterized protein n=1 Tax=Glycomyces terrestris TaxID=2493553 RepID=A0A426V4X6_9ACTN|nr:hypothetical protein [Glycomyces terrestris]RRS01880.1 hypothetical protein EIW28_03810 [Glycomyces terrestris]
MQVSWTPFRLLRAAVFAAVSGSASLLLHLWSGGHAPGPLQSAAAFGLVFAAAYAAGGRRRGFLVLAPLCLAAQWGLHELFQAGAVDAAHAHGSGLSMWLVHVAAALAQASWLARGETAFAALLELLTLWFARLVRVAGLNPPAAVRPRRLPPRTRAPRPEPVAYAAISRRGPPRPAF